MRGEGRLSASRRGARAPGVRSRGPALTEIERPLVQSGFGGGNAPSAGLRAPLSAPPPWRSFGSGVLRRLRPRGSGSCPELRAGRGGQPGGETPASVPSRSSFRGRVGSGRVGTEEGDVCLAGAARALWRGWGAGSLRLFTEKLEPRGNVSKPGVFRRKCPLRAGDSELSFLDILVTLGK